MYPLFFIPLSFFWCLYFSFTLAVLIFYPNLNLHSLWPSLPIPQTTSADFKTVLHLEFITRDMDFKKGEGEKRPSINCPYKE